MSKNKIQNKNSTELIYDSMSDSILDITEKLVKKDGVHTITVRKILEELGITNRVFYNRFKNVDEVLELVYTKLVMEMRKTVRSDIDPEKDFFGYITDLGVKALMATYEIKMEFSRYMFEHDSLTNANRVWWTDEIKKIIGLGKDLGVIKKDIDDERLAYSIWCFLRGFNADAVLRKISKEEAMENFKFGFECLLNGVKA